MEELLSAVKVHHSRKRKNFHPSTSSSHPSIGISRPDPVPREPKSFPPETESVEALLGANSNNASRISSIKDLRMRRVFTPDVNSVLEEEEEETDDDRKKLMKGSDSTLALDSNIGDAKLDELEKSEIMAHKTDDTRNDFENGPNFKNPEISGNGSDSKSKMAPNSCRRKKVFKTSSSFSYKRLLPYLMDIVNDESSVTKLEIVDALIPCKLQKLNGLKSETMSFAEKSSSANAKCVVPQFDDTKTEMPFNQHGLSGAETEMGQAAEVIGASTEKECVQTTPPDSAFFCNTEEQQISKDSEKSNSHVLRQSLSSNRSVLNPCSRLRQSLSFKRLLPFLMNSSCDSGITLHPVPQVDLIKDNVEQNHVNDTKTDINGDRMTNLPLSDGSAPETNNNNSVSSEPLMPDLHTAENAPQSHNSDHTELEPCLVLPSSSTIDDDISNQQSTSTEPGPVGIQKGCLDMGLELHNNNGESTEASNAMVSPAIGSCKGILKRNRRGCRGLCNCLNCASFRLHADRAFEFSRNQMHDVEEVASDLMSELASLRLLLEKSIVSNNDLAAIQLNSVVIKEACSKALEAENIAKERFSQLNYDLDVHCRTPILLEPKVTFANYIQQRAIPVLDTFADTENKKG
ncbi:hypothetical protein PHJA_002816300 [Phtheirospermum japonicum]|uniref:Uncharacterized protein n=1 Tax=Phtheirospermum japonicum TaxID=374723 RepID=A0A830D7U9_9LAMI|nr:hypothetical protein PHJA_002816300 [Phtheirospermum japonicum]